MTETWRAIAGYDNMYEVSNLGRVRSFVPSIKARNIPHVLSQGNLRGYRVVNLPRLDRPGRYCPLVHRLVAEAFIGPPPEQRSTVNHKDYDKANNRVENLEWMSQADNCRHSKDVIPRLRGEANRSKLTEEQVRQIRSHYEIGGVTCDELADLYGVSGVTIWKIVRRKKWAHVT